MTTESKSGIARLTGIAPQFLVDDVDAAIAYYRGQLGFELDFCYESFYASVRRDGQQTALGVVDRLRQADLRKLDTVDGRLHELAQMVPVEQARHEVEHRRDDVVHRHWLPGRCSVAGQAEEGPHDP